MNKQTPYKKQVKSTTGPFDSKSLPDYQAAMQHYQMQWAPMLSGPQNEIVQFIIGATARFGRRTSCLKRSTFMEGIAPNMETHFAGVAPIRDMGKRRFVAIIQELKGYGILVKQSGGIRYGLDYSVTMSELIGHESVIRRVLHNNKRGGAYSSLEKIAEAAAKALQWFFAAPIIAAEHGAATAFCTTDYLENETDEELEEVVRDALALTPDDELVPFEEPHTLEHSEIGTTLLVVPATYETIPVPAAVGKQSKKSKRTAKQKAHQKAIQRKAVRKAKEAHEETAQSETREHTNQTQQMPILADNTEPAVNQVASTASRAPSIEAAGRPPDRENQTPARVNATNSEKERMKITTTAETYTTPATLTEQIFPYKYVNIGRGLIAPSLPWGTRSSPPTLHGSALPSAILGFLRNRTALAQMKPAVSEISRRILDEVGKKREKVREKRRSRQNPADLCSLFELGWSEGQRERGPNTPILRLTPRDRKSFKNYVLPTLKDVEINYEEFGRWLTSHWSYTHTTHFNKAKSYPRNPAFQWFVTCISTYTQAFIDDKFSAASITDAQMRSRADSYSYTSKQLAKVKTDAHNSRVQHDAKIVMLERKVRQLERDSSAFMEDGRTQVLARARKFMLAVKHFKGKLPRSYKIDPKLTIEDINAYRISRGQIIYPDYLPVNKVPGFDLEEYYGEDF